MDFVELLNQQRQSRVVPKGTVVSKYLSVISHHFSARSTHYGCYFRAENESVLRQIPRISQCILFPQLRKECLHPCYFFAMPHEVAYKLISKHSPWQRFLLTLKERVDTARYAIGQHKLDWTAQRISYTGQTTRRL